MGQVAARLQLYTAAAVIQEPTHFSCSPAFRSLLPFVVSAGFQVQLCFGMFVNRKCGFKLGQSAQCIVKQCSQQYNVRKAEGLFIKCFSLKPKYSITYYNILEQTERIICFHLCRKKCCRSLKSGCLPHNLSLNTGNSFSQSSLQVAPCITPDHKHLTDLQYLAVSGRKVWMEQQS